MTQPPNENSPPIPHASNEGRRFALILAFICAAAFFLRLGANGLFDLDEALYANAAREMVLRGDYVSPRVNGALFFEKPPFIYWCAALFFRGLGVSELAARLPSALASTATAFLIFTFGNRRFGVRAGFLAGAFFALSPIVLGAGRQLTTDATLTFWITSALLCFFTAHYSQTSNAKRWYYGFWASCGFGVLTKGAPGFVLPAFIVIAYLCLLEKFHLRPIVGRLVDMKPLAGIGLFLAISVPWLLAAWRTNGEPFYQEYILRQHLQRFRGGDEAHRLPFWFYIPGFVLGFFPWSMFAIPAVFERWSRTGPNSRSLQDEGQLVLPSSTTTSPTADVRLLLKVWFWVVFIVFSASGSKLISYVLPLYPAAALLAGDWCARAVQVCGKRRSLVIGGICALGLTAVVFLAVTFYGPLIRLIEAVSHQPARVDSVPAEFLALAQNLFGVGAAATGLFVGMVLFGGRRAKADSSQRQLGMTESVPVEVAESGRVGMPVYSALCVLVAGMFVFVLVAVLEGLPVIDSQFSAPLREACARGAALLRPGEQLGVFIGEPRRPSVFFYLPEDLIAPRGGASHVVETTDDVKIAEIIQAAGHKVIISDAKRTSLVESMPRCRAVFRAGPWTVLETDTWAARGFPRSGRNLD